MKKLFLSLTTLIFLSTIPAFAGQTAVVDTTGLVCDFCAQALKKTFSKEERVDYIEVDLDASTVTIFFKEDADLTDAEIEDLISRGGYDITGIRRVENTDLQD